MARASTRITAIALSLCVSAQGSAVLPMRPIPQAARPAVVVSFGQQAVNPSPVFQHLPFGQIQPRLDRNLEAILLSRGPLNPAPTYPELQKLLSDIELHAHAYKKAESMPHSQPRTDQLAESKQQLQELSPRFREAIRQSTLAALSGKPSLEPPEMRELLEHMLQFMYTSAYQDFFTHWQSGVQNDFPEAVFYLLIQMPDALPDLQEILTKFDRYYNPFRRSVVHHIRPSTRAEMIGLLPKSHRAPTDLFGLLKFSTVSSVEDPLAAGDVDAALEFMAGPHREVLSRPFDGFLYAIRDRLRKGDISSHSGLGISSRGISFLLQLIDSTPNCDAAGYALQQAVETLANDPHFSPSEEDMRHIEHLSGDKDLAEDVGSIAAVAVRNDARLSPASLAAFEKLGPKAREAIAGALTHWTHADGVRFDHEKARAVVKTLGAEACATWLEYLAFKQPEIFDPPFRIWLQHQQETCPAVKYALFYVSMHAGMPPTSGTAVLAHDILTKPNAKVLVVGTEQDGRGEDVQRNVALIEAMLALNPTLTVHIYTEYPDAYSLAGRVFPCYVGRRIYDMNKFDVVIDHDSGYPDRGPRRREKTPRAGRLYIETRRHTVATLSEYGATRPETHYSIPTVRVGDRFLHIEEFHIDETDNMYLATYRLLAELGIPFHHGIKPPGALSILPGRVQQNFRRDRPLLVLNIWGGQEIDKGYEAFSNKEEILGQDLTVAVNKGYHVILPSFSHATRDGARSKDEWVKKVLSRLPRDIGSHVELGPSPDSQKDDYNDLIRTADLVVTVEGGLMHWVYNLGRRMRVLSMPGSGLLRIFLSVGADSEQLGLPGNDFNQLPSAEELKNQDTETPVPAKTFKGELSWKWLSAIRAERPWLANAIEVAMTAGLYLGIRLFLASLSAGDLASAWAPVLPAAMGFAALHFIGEASSWDAEGNLRTGKLTPLGFAGLTLASLLFILPFAPLSLTVVLTFHGLYSLSASWLGAGLISYGVHFGLYNPHLSRLIAKQWPRLARLFVRGMMGSVPSERFTELLKEIGITRDKDIKRILSGDKYKTPEELEERIRDVSAAIRRVEEEVDMPGFAMPDSSKRAIMKTYLINRARPLDNIVMRPLTDLKVNDLKAHDFVMAHAPQMQAWARYLVNNFKESYRDQETFEDQLRDAVEEFTASIQQKPFAVALHHKGSSNDWVLNLALEMGLPKPVQVVDADNEDNDTLVADRFDNILIIDDAAYTGKQIAIESPASLPANRDRRRKHLHVVIPFMTPEAETRISSEFRHSSGFLIKVYAHQTLGDGAAGPSVRLMGKYFDYFQHILPDDTASVSYHQTTGAGRGRPPTVLRAGVVLDDMGLLKGNRVPFLDGYVDRPYRSGYVQDVRNYLISNWDTRICLSAIERSVSRESLVKLIKDMFDIYSNTSDRERMDWLIGQVRALESAGLIDLTATGIRQAAQQLTFIREFQEGHDSKDSMALMPDGRTFVIPSYDGPKPAGKSVNAVSGQFKFIFTNLQHPGPARLSSGGQRAAVAGYEEMVARTGQTVLSAKIFVIDVGTDREIARFDVNSRLRSFTISSNGKSLITVDDGKLHVINIQTRKVRAFPIGQYSGGNPQSLENDRVVIQKVPINGEEELEYGIINYKVGKENVERTIRTPRSSSYEFLGNSQEGKHIVIAGRDKIRIIDADDISHVEEINPPPIPFVSVCYSASARAFVFGLKDGKIQYWRFEDLLSAALPNGTENPVPSPKSELSWKWLSDIRAERPWLANAIEVAITAGLYLGLRLFLVSFGAGDLVSAWIPVLPSAMGFAALHFIGQVTSWDAQGRLQTGKLTPLGFVGLTLASFFFILPFAPLSLTVVLTFHGLYSLAASWLGAGLISYGVHFGLYNPIISRFIAKHWPRLARMFVRGMIDFRWPGSERSRAFPRGVPPHLEQISA